MAALFDNGRIVALIALLVLVEGTALVIYARATGHGLKPTDIALMLLPGLFLLLALREALVGEDWTRIAMLLALALVAHLGDLWRRMRVS
jgi:hypothetical protein